MPRKIEQLLQRIMRHWYHSKQMYRPYSCGVGRIMTRQHTVKFILLVRPTVGECIDTSRKSRSSLEMLSSDPKKVLTVSTEIVDPEYIYLTLSYYSTTFRPRTDRCDGSQADKDTIADTAISYSDATVI